MHAELVFYSALFPFYLEQPLSAGTSDPDASFEQTSSNGDDMVELLQTELRAQYTDDKGVQTLAELELRLKTSAPSADLNSSNADLSSLASPKHYAMDGEKVVSPVGAWMSPDRARAMDRAARAAAAASPTHDDHPGSPSLAASRNRAATDSVAAAAAASDLDDLAEAPDGRPRSVSDNTSVAAAAAESKRKAVVEAIQGVRVRFASERRGSTDGKPKSPSRADTPQRQLMVSQLCEVCVRESVCEQGQSCR